MTAVRRSFLFCALCLLPATSGCALWHGRAAGSDAGPVPSIDAAPIAVDAAVAVDSGACPVGQQYFYPGCVSEPGIRIDEGCYQPCAGPGDRSCAPGFVCDQTNVDPCVCGPGLDCCAACGADAWLCLPWHSTPVVPCDGRDYCTCDGSCAPLIDLSTGCVCPCDEPFHCGGLPCDCDCGGATYLGCAPMGRCEQAEIQCTPPERAVLIDGCPQCRTPRD